MRLMTFPNVIVCGHQAFVTEEGMTEIVECTMRNLGAFTDGALQQLTGSLWR